MSKYLGHVSVIASSLLAGTLIFTGCGGGGSTTTVSGASTTVTGKAVDELILNGVVEVHANSAAGEIIGSGRTSTTDGTYTIDVDGFEGVAVVSVTCDANSTLYFPDTNTTESCPTDTHLYSAAPVEGDGSVTVNVAPSTHVMFMMATGGDANATLDKQKVEEARTAAAQIFGTDPISSDPTEGIYAEVIQAFHDAAQDANKSIQELVEEIAEDAADGELGDDSNATSLLAQNMQENNVTTPFVEAAESNSTFTPEVPDNAATLDDVAAAKALFQNLRTQGDDLLEDGGLFDSEAKAMESLVENTALNGDLAGTVLGKLADAIGYGIENNLTSVSKNLVTLPSGDSRDANLTRDDIASNIWSYVITDTVGGSSTQRASGSITLPAADPDNDIDPSAFTTLNFVFDGTLPATKLYETTQSVQSFQASATMTKTTDGAHLEVSDINLSTADGTMVGIKGFKADMGYDYNASNSNDPMTLNYVKVNEITLNGALDQNYTATGTLSIGYTMNSIMAAEGGFTEVWKTEVEGEVGCIDPVTSQWYSDYNNSGFSVNLGNTTYHINTDASGYFRTEIDGEYYYDDLQNAQISFDTNCTQGVQTFEWMNTSTDSDIKIGNSGYIPNSMTLNGSIKNVQTDTEFSGMAGVSLLNAADINVSADEDPHARVTLSGTLKRAGLDDMSLNLELEHNPDTKVTDTTLAYVYGATTVNAQGTYNENTKEGNVTVTSGNGLAITVVFDQDGIDYNATTPLTKDGKVVGTLDNETGVDRIKYIDGSFESLP